MQINKYRSKWMKWEIPFEEDEEIGNFWCCGLTKEHLEAFIFWAVNCWRWSRKSSGRNDIKYRQYRPLKGIPDETIHGNSRHGNEDQEMQPIRSSHGDALDDSTHNVIHEASSRGSGRARSNTSTSVKSEGVGVGRYINQHGDRDDDDEDCIDEDSSSEEEMGVAPADVNHHRGRWLNEMLR